MLTDHQYLQEAYALATFSHDLSTQNGAVIVGKDGACLTVGINDIPKKVCDTPERRERPAKYLYTEHAERAAILSAARWGIRLNGATMYCPWFACADCARAIIQAGIVEVVGHQLDLHGSREDWSETVKAGLVMLSEAGVRTRWLAGTMHRTIRFNGKQVSV